MRTHLALIVFAAACGQSSSSNEGVGQVKTVMRKTPLICPDYFEIDISLGVMRNGVGSMSHEDVRLAVDGSQAAMIALARDAAEAGQIVKFSYDVQRLSLCWPDHRLTGLMIEPATAAASERTSP